MKKKYTNYKAGLLIGLLSFHILSSCVNTRLAARPEDMQRKHGDYGYHLVVNTPATSARSAYNNRYINVAWITLFALVGCFGYFTFTYQKPLHLNTTEVHANSSMFTLDPSHLNTSRPSNANGSNNSSILTKQLDQFEATMASALAHDSFKERKTTSTSHPDAFNATQLE